MLNKHGKGEIYFGIRNDGKVIGQQVSDKTLRDISQGISNFIEPKIYPTIEIIRIEGNDCVRVAFEGNDSPYFAYGRAYMRISDEDRTLSPKEIERIILDNNSNRSYWDYQRSNSAQEMVDEYELNRFLENAIQAGRLETKKDDKIAILDKLGLLDGDKLRNAGERDCFVQGSY